MVKENEYEFNTLNIPQWHSRGYKGKGITWASLENNTKHNKMVVDVVNQIAPEATEYANYSYSKIGSVNQTAPRFMQFIKECIDNKVDLITCSYNYEDNAERRQAIQMALDAGIIITWAAGNDNTDIGPKQVRHYFNDIIHVGAIFGALNRKIERALYSNKGPLLDLVGFTDIWTTNKSLFSGTSCATPVVAGSIILLLQFLKDNGLPKEEYIHIINSNTIDLGVSGRDDLFGKGLFILPDLDKISIEGDNMSQAIRDLNELLPQIKELAEKLLIKCKEQKIPIVITETYRTQERQNELYAQGRTTQGPIVTWTKNSYHTTRKAFDFCPIDAKGNCLWSRYDLFAKVGAIGKELGLFWGGDWTTPDRPHFQYNGVIKVEEVKTWQEIELDKMISSGLITDKEYWMSKWNETITVKDVIGLLSKVLARDNEKDMRK